MFYADQEKIVFAKSYVCDELDLPGRNCNPEIEVIIDEICDRSRWSVDYNLVIRHKATDTYWRTWYSVGATESQDEGPWEYADTVEFVQVYPRKVEEIRYMTKTELKNKNFE
jgi:hypothetical protein